MLSLLQKISSVEEIRASGKCWARVLARPAFIRNFEEKFSVMFRLSSTRIILAVSPKVSSLSALPIPSFTYFAKASQFFSSRAASFDDACPQSKPTREQRMKPTLSTDLCKRV